MKFRYRASIAVATTGWLLIAGCSSDGPKTIPVYGTVTFVGREAPKTCRLFFRPIKTEGMSRPTLAERQPDGSYEAKAYSHSKGLVPGTYRVEVSYYDLKPGKDPNLETSWAETNYDNGELVVDADSNGIEHNFEVPRKT